MEKYEELEMEVIVFNSDDIIVTSGEEGDIPLPPL